MGLYLEAAVDAQDQDPGAPAASTVLVSVIVLPLIEVAPFKVQVIVLEAVVETTTAIALHRVVDAVKPIAAALVAVVLSFKSTTVCTLPGVMSAKPAVTCDLAM